MTEYCRRFALAVVAALLVVATDASGQYLTRPQIPWRTITTARFEIHFPAELEEWTKHVAVRMETISGAVSSVVGNAPAARVTVIVEDPSNVANGFALPFMEGPVIFLWPTPPTPSPTFGAHRGWGEALAVHEYAHLAHLTFPSRNPRDRWIWRLLPVRISPIARKAPPWVIEGYATVIEGQLTGSGRPASAGRAAVLRQWALDGRFPTYGQLNGSGAFLGGNMRYLVGSAFLEWLQARRGDSSLVHLWRRMSARQDRSFDAAFAGVFGASAPDLYGAFTVDVMERALRIRSRLRDAGLVEGELVQRLVGATGEPAVSPDGDRVAVVVRALTGPSRLVVWRTEQEPDTALARARARLLEQDTLDVAPYDSFPPPRRALATLRPLLGRSHEHPRWMPDGETILVSRDEPADFGATRPDLFLWSTRSGDVSRVTRGAGIRQADPSPDGRQAAAVRCHAGSCSLVLVQLSSGTWRVLAPGTPDRVWHRPRFSPDGSQVAASVQEQGRWGIALVDVRSGAVRRLQPSGDESRYAPSFGPSGQDLVVVSEGGGIANLESIDLDSLRPRTLTRVTGGVLAPDVNRRDGSTWFLALRSGGYDLRRLPPGASSGPAVEIAGEQVPAAPPTPAQAGIDVGSLAEPGARAAIHNYGIGPRRWRVLPGLTFGADGMTGTVMVANIDPIARLSLVAQAGNGTPGTWRGASLGAMLRRPVAVEGSVWWAATEPHRQPAHLLPPWLETRYAGAGVLARVESEGSTWATLLRAGGSIGRMDGPAFDGDDRTLFAGEWRGRWSRSVSGSALHVLGTATFALGGTGEYDWQRTTATLGVVYTAAGWRARGDWLRGRAASRREGSPLLVTEQFLVGGSPTPYVDPIWLSQHIPLPAVPLGFVTGTDVQVLRASLSSGAWEPYVAWLAAGDAVDELQGRARLGDVKRLYGIERAFSVNALGFARLPSVRLRAGAGWSPDEPFARRPRVYGSVIWSP